ncbi:hypothetical protein ACFV0T_20865 [Streptomyces sp. NPDC059582]|uniref:hypothetical protein n=1 Tax=Streptomyces sp. NPDC059582 TaxID=3346875 RepID=UPI0036B27ACB
MSASPAVRSLRAAVFAAVCVLLAAAGHGLATGNAPPLWADGAGFLAVFAAGWLLGGRERSLPGIGTAMLATQAVLHLAFSRAVTTAPATHMAHMAHMTHLRGDGHPVTQAHAMHTNVVAAHFLAALVASWWLRRGEAAVWSLLRRAVTFLPGLRAWWRDPAAPPPLPAAGRTPVDTLPPRTLLLRHAVSRRGPPAWIPYAG